MSPVTIRHTGYDKEISSYLHTEIFSPSRNFASSFVDTDMQPNSTVTEVSAHLSEVSPDPSTNMPGSQTTATATSARDNLPAPRRPQPIFFSNIYAQATSNNIFNPRPHAFPAQHLLYCPAYHGLNIYCPAPRIAGYQSPFPFVCASWTGV